MNRWLLWMALALSCLTGCGRSPVLLDLSGPTMGTTYSVKVVAPPPGFDTAALQGEIDRVLQAIDEQMSGYRDDSDISRFNRSSSTDWFEVPPEVAKLVAASARISELSKGALDITVAPLVNLWGMGPAGELRDLPTADQLAQARANVGYQRLTARENPAALRKELPQLSVDFNGVAPGYAVDLLAQRLSERGVANFMIDIGGEVRAHGRNAQDELWRIAVERPVDAEPEPYAIVRIDNGAVTTSGEYRHYVMRDGHRYSHTIDPHTGRPVEHKLASVVVAMPTAFEADAWATALNVLGEEAGYILANEQRIPAMFIVDTGSGFDYRTTAGFDDSFAVKPR